MGETSFLSSLWDGAKSFGSGAMGWLGNGENLKGLGALVGGVGGAYGALEQSKQAKAMLDLQKGAYGDERERQKKAQLAIDSAWGVNPTATNTTARLSLV